MADELRLRVDTIRSASLGASALTTAELRLLPLLPTHLSFREIGERLHVSRHTIKTQSISIYRKLGVSSRSETIDRMLELGLLDPRVIAARSGASRPDRRASPSTISPRLDGQRHFNTHHNARPGDPLVERALRRRRRLGCSARWQAVVMAIERGALAAIGATPVVRLGGLCDDRLAAVWVKMEGANPTGSYKDRMALAMIRGAERDGRLRPGQTVVEYTGGSTGSSLAFVCAVTGHPLRIVTSDAFAVEKLLTMEAFGAMVEIVSSPAGITPDLIPRMRARAADVAAEVDGFQTDQFRNTDMIDGYVRLGEEVVEQVPAPVDALCLYVGTAGCFLGVSRALRAVYPSMRRVVVEPAESAVLSGGPAGTHRIEGGGVGFLPDLLDRSDFDDVIAVPTADAFEMARRAATTDGIFSGPSTGANLIASLQVAEALGPGCNVVTVQVDSGLKYLAGPLYRAST